VDSVSEPQRPVEDAFERAVAALAAKERTTGEVEELLRAHGHGTAETAAAIGRLIEIGELDDERFARRYAEDKRELSGWGANRIRDALTARRLDRETIEAALGADGEQGELERAVALLERRGEPAVDERSRGRALGYLARRGYDSETAHDAVRRFEAGEDGRRS
jgi:regulatory protein